MAHRLSQLHEAGSMTHEQASLVKAWNTSRGREVLSLGRELLGGNGVVADFHVAKVGVIWSRNRPCRANQACACNDPVVSVWACNSSQWMLWDDFCTRCR